MAHAQKPDFVFRRNSLVHLNRRSRQFSRLLAAVVRISGNNAGYTMFRGSVKVTGCPLHSPVSPSLPILCVSCAIIFQLDSGNDRLLLHTRARARTHTHTHTHTHRGRQNFKYCKKRVQGANVRCQCSQHG